MSGSQEYFARVAGQWDTLRSGYFTEAMRDAAIDRVQLSPQSVVADVGTGTGFVIQGLAPRVARVYGFDQSVEVLAVAENNLAAFNNVELRQSQGETLPLPDNCLDAIFGNMYLHHAEDPARAICEMVRVLRPGGKLLLTDVDSHDQEWMRIEMADRWLGFERQDILNWYQAAGLVDIEIGDAFGTCNATKPEGDLMKLNIFFALGTKRASQILCDVL